MKRSLQDALDGDVPWDVPHWIVEFHWESDDVDLLPLPAAQKALAEISQRPGHWCVVTHVRSGLQWSVDLTRQEWFEVVTHNGVAQELDRLRTLNAELKAALEAALLLAMTSVHRSAQVLCDHIRTVLAKAKEQR
jgi:uncharacterized protein YecA (UPF0149 family)